MRQPTPTRTSHKKRPGSLKTAHRHRATAEEAAGGRSSPPVHGWSRAPWLPPLLLLLWTALVYAPSLRVPMLEWDDSTYFFRDARMDPITWTSLGRILTQPFFANFHPVTTLTIALDRAVWGVQVKGFHVTHLAFYFGGVLGLYFLFAHLTRSRPAAWIAAALYAVHPIHVESAAWLASRKDVVCLFFYVLALLAYVRYAGAREGRAVPYGAAFVLTALAMMSKGYAVILPAAFLAYDFCFSPRLTRRNLLDKIPFVLLAAATVILTVHAQDRDSALMQSALGLGGRAALLAKVFALYVGHTLVPVGLSAFYLIAGEPLGSMPLVGLLLAAGLIVSFFYLRRKLPVAAFGIALFLLPLATVMNFVFTLRIWMADRYLFLPTIGSSLALVALALPLVRARAASGAITRSRVRSRGLFVGALLVIVLYSTLTVRRINLWSSRVDLWSDVVRRELHLGGSGPVVAADLARMTNVRSSASTPIVNLAQAYEAAGNGAEAERISTFLGRAGGGRGMESVMTLAREDLAAGRNREAIERLKPIAGGTSWLAPLATMWIAVGMDRMGDSLAAQSAVQDGIQLYRRTGQPATDGLFSIGAMEFNRGRYERAIGWYTLAQREAPRDAKVVYNLGRALEEGGHLNDALAQYRRIPDEALPIPDGTQFTIFDVFLQMGIVSEKLGRLPDAIRYCEEAIRRAPADPRRQTVQQAIATLRSRIK